MVIPILGKYGKYQQVWQSDVVGFPNWPIDFPSLRLITERNTKFLSIWSTNGMEQPRFIWGKLVDISKEGIMAVFINCFPSAALAPSVLPKKNEKIQNN